jgi:hypothetical protein
LPDQQVRVPPASVDVRGERVEPDDAGGDVGVRRAPGVEAERARQEVHAQVQPDARVEQVLYLLVRLVAGDRRVELDRDQVGGADAEPAGQLADDHLGDQRARALAGAAELADVGAQVVGLDDARERAALAQRRDVACGGDGGDHQTNLPALTRRSPRRSAAPAASTS